MGRARYGVQEEVKDASDAFYRAVSAHNLKSIDASWAHVPYAAVAGPYGELHQGWDAVRSFWEARMQALAGVTMSVRLTSMVCHAVGDVAWISGVERRRVTEGDSSWVEDLRVTCVMERRDAGWQIVSYHASFPAEADEALADAS